MPPVRTYQHGSVVDSTSNVVNHRHAARSKTRWRVILQATFSLGLNPTGRKPTKKASIQPVHQDDDPFDALIFGARRSPHPFSSSSEAIPTPSPGPSCEPSWSGSIGYQFLSGRKIGLHRLDSKSKVKSKIRKNHNKKPVYRIFKEKEDFKRLVKASGSRKEAGKQLGVPICASTPIRRVHLKRARGAEADSSCPRNKLVVPNWDVSETASPVLTPNVSAILRSLLPSSSGKLRLPVQEVTPISSGIPQRTSMDSITNRMLRMDLAGASVKVVDLSMLSESSAETQGDGKSGVHKKSLPSLEQPIPQAGPSISAMSMHGTAARLEKDLSLSRLGLSDAQVEGDAQSQCAITPHKSVLTSVESPPFLGFSSIASAHAHTFVPPSADERSLYLPSPCYVTRRKHRLNSVKTGGLLRSQSGVTDLINTPSAVGTLGFSRRDDIDSREPKGPGSRSERLDETSAGPSSTAAANFCSESFMIRRRNLQRASDHVTNESLVSPEGSLLGDSPVDPNGTSKQLSREDSGSGGSLENAFRRRQLPLRTDAAVQGSVEISSPDGNRSGVEASTESLGRSPGGGSGSGMSSEDAAKRKQTLWTMDPTKRDSSDIASPESNHSGMDSSNESALEEVGISLRGRERLSGPKEGCSSGTSSEDFCSMDSVPSSPERAGKSWTTRTMDMSNFRRRVFNEPAHSSRSSAREDLMSSSEDENDEEGYADLLSRPSDVALYQPYEPGSLEPLHENVEKLDDEDENSSLSSESSAKKSPVETGDSNRTPNMRRKASRHSEERSPTGRSSLGRASVIPELVSVIEEDSMSSDTIGPLEDQPLEHFVLQPGKRYRRSLLIIQNVDVPSETDGQKGRLYHSGVEEVLRLQTSHSETLCETPVQMIRKRISLRRSSWIKQNTPPPRRRLTLPPKTPDRSSVTLETPAALRLPLRLTNRSLLADRTLLRPSNVHDVDPATVELGKEAILRLCQQTQLATFSDILPPEGSCSKLGEGVYGEVFAVKRNDTATVLKIIPVEGSRRINGADQKTYHEIAPELIIARELHNLREGGICGASNGTNKAGGFAEVEYIKLVQGCYPTQLLECWDKFNEEQGSENDRPDTSKFTETQQFIVLAQANAGKALEDYNFSNANIALSLFKQVTFSLAVAECALSFEHRDLHWGNVLISRTTDRKYTYLINSREVSVPAHGVRGTIIDYTLSRMSTNNGPLYNDLSKDPELFLGTGDVQFDVYRQMKKDVNNEWSQFQPKTNARWLYYIVDKLLKKEYQRKTAKVHKDGLKVLRNIEGWIETCDSALEVAERLAQL